MILKPLMAPADPLRRGSDDLDWSAVSECGNIFLKIWQIKKNDFALDKSELKFKGNRAFFPTNSSKKIVQAVISFAEEFFSKDPRGHKKSLYVPNNNFT